MQSIQAGKAVVQSVARVRRMFTLGLAGVAFLWLFVIPAAEVWQRHNEARLEAEIRLGLVADRISSFVAANLDIWEFEGVRLPSVVAGVMRGGTNPPSRLAFINAMGEVNEFPVQGVVGRFNLEIEDVVTDGRRPVGRVVMTVPLDEALRPALLSGSLGLGSMALLLLLVRMVGRKALDQSLSVIEDTTDSLGRRIRELEETRQLLAAQSVHLTMATQDITHVAQLTTHHLREPLRTVLSYSQLLVRWHEAGGKGDEAGGYVDFLKSGVIRMQTQLKALSAYLGLRERSMSPTPVALEDAVKVAVRRLDSAVVVEWGDLPILTADAEMLADLVADLLAHMARHGRPGCTPKVHIQAFALSGDWEIRLADDGLPLAERDRDRMFQLLVHGDGGEMRPGLAAARLMAFLLGGALWVEDGAGDGVVLCFTLPRHPPIRI
ncbi:sensor histidine kinase [Paramagnetospirillum magneticum]|uniref:histidine kinase n=1 Tax=Paramagnetospirillum magneticum (strain ATCC 700264 / AMB-1) TaxID=342108 RepID=Q2W3R7_PARM1|nr:ATP-binding protein [Paramagnetospirillum magneticum]BAE51508.1 Signal transduction histidine kinase [Paramagnetospirillum magneticum AMB-1]